ncbi:MAG TPA: DUF5666 domain-containing protein [Candidatus Moranbacteria bacterium]|nr:DUF5666 domain-containing protein [Candidatus Moranbacteria bacterium]
MQNKIVISLIGVIVAITILVIGILIGKKFSDNVAVTSDNTQASFQAGYNAAKAKFEKVYSEVIIPSNATDSSIVGVIHEIDGNKIKVAIRSNDPLNDTTPSETKTIIVTDSTKITIGVPKDPEEIKKKMQKGDFDPNILIPEYKNSTLSDLKVNQFVVVSAAKNNNELTATEIKAQNINVEAIPEKPTTATQE